MLVKLSDDIYVSANEIIEIRVDCYGTDIMVKTKDGRNYQYVKYRTKGIYDVLDELVEQVNKAISQNASA